MCRRQRGNLYGAPTTSNAKSWGAVFELSPSKAGDWTFTSLHAFYSGGGDGNSPYGTLILDKEDNLYGTTYGGGAYGAGTVFEVTP